MSNLKTIYLTLVHAALAAAIFLYTSDNYTLARIEHGNQVTASAPECCGSGDDLSAMLDSHLRKHNH